MLILSRKIGEQVYLDLSGLGITEPLKVTLVQIRGGEKARIGFEAHEGIRVHRKEVWEAIQRGEGRKPKDESA
jgi:carbon storage regulator CsrA